MGGYPTLETARLALRPVEMADAPAIQRLFPQWEIVRHLNAGVPWPYPEDGAESFSSTSFFRRSREANAGLGRSSREPRPVA